MILNIEMMVMPINRVITCIQEFSQNEKENVVDKYIKLKIVFANILTIDFSMHRLCKLKCQKIRDR